METKNLPFWGTLGSGSYAVGFKNTHIYDYARFYAPKYQYVETPTQDELPRPLRINIWYPASKAVDTKTMLYGEYLDISFDVLELEPFSQELSHFNFEAIAIYVVGKPASKLDEAGRKAYDKIMATPTAAIRNAAPVAGKFPLLIHHQGLGGTVEENAVLWEYLASQGYVIVSSTYQPTSGETLRIDGDLERSIKDLDRIINFMQNQPNVDINRVGMMGHSYGAEAALAYRAENNSVVRAVISLDSTLEYPPIVGTDDEREGLIPFFTRILSRVQNMSVPMLIVARQSERNGEPIINDDDNSIVETSFALCDALEYADRYYMSISGLGHNDVISQGVIESEFSQQSDPTKTYLRVIRETYEVICLYILHFCNSYLKGDVMGLEFLKRNPSENGISLRSLLFQYKERQR